MSGRCERFRIASFNDTVSERESLALPSARSLRRSSVDRGMIAKFYIGPAHPFAYQRLGEPSILQIVDKIMAKKS